MSIADKYADKIRPLVKDGDKARVGRLLLEMDGLYKCQIQIERRIADEYKAMFDSAMAENRELRAMHLDERD